jgi:hypothetical protein
LQSLAPNQHSNLGRTAFEKKKLIYDFDSLTWLSPDQCIWADDSVRLEGKSSISSQYAKQKPFFQKILNIQAPKLRSFVKSLKDKTSTSSKPPSTHDIKETIKQIATLSPKLRDLEDVLDSKCFPILRPDGNLEWMDCMGDFVIADRRKLRTLFAGRLAMLDFSLEEVHACEPFLRAFSVQKKYLSGILESETRPTNSLPEPRFTANLRKKAYAICRYVFHVLVVLTNRSSYVAHLRKTATQQDAEKWFRMLRNVEVFTSVAISKSLTVRQNGKNVTVVEETAYCHVVEEERPGHGQDAGNTEEKTLKIHIPQDPGRRHISVLIDLPMALLKHFGVHQTGPGELVSIISANDLDTVDAILEEAGIILIPGCERLQEEQLLLPLEDDVEISTMSQHFGINGENHLQRNVGPDHLSGNRGAGEYLKETYSPIPKPALFCVSPEHNKLYTKMLEQLVRASRKHGLPSAPLHGTIYNTWIESPLSEHEISLAVDGPTRNIRIGAAGELYVMPLLIHFFQSINKTRYLNCLNVPMALVLIST